MSNDKTINDVYVLVARMEERQLNIAKDAAKSILWQEKHEEKDEERFASLNKYATSIAIVAGFAGACGMYILKQILVI